MNIAMIGSWHVHSDEYVEDAIKNEKSNVVSVWDDDTARGKAFAEKHSLSFIENLDDILNDRSIDSVIVCSATNLHEEIMIKIANAKKNIFTEKVLTFTMDSAKKVCDAVDESDKVFTISFPHRTFGKVKYLKNLVDGGSLGKITYMRVRNVHGGSIDNWLPEHFYNKEMCGGGAMMDLGAHPMYLLSWFMGKPRNITSTFTNVTDRAVEDNAVSVIEFDNGAIGVSETGFVSKNYPYMIEISGTLGGAMIVGNTVTYCNESTNNEWVTAVDVPINEASPINQWIDCVVSGGKSPFDTNDAFLLTQLMEGAYISHEKNIRYVY